MKSNCLRNGQLMLIAILVLNFLGLPGYSQEETSFFSNGKEIPVDEFDRKIELALEALKIPGASIGVIENNQIVYHSNYGYKDRVEKEKVDETTVFEAASISKIFFLYAVSQVIEKGLLDPEKPMYQYLKHDQLDHDERYKKITPRMILSHTSGLENWKRMNKKDTLEIMADPGTKFIYSGEGYNYLADVLSVILDQSYEEYMDSLVLQPLQLEQTFLKYIGTETAEVGPTNYAVGHTEQGEPIEKWKNLEAVPASGIHTTAGEVARLITAMFDQHHLKQESLDRLTEGVIPMGPGGNDVSLQMTMGFFLIEKADQKIIGFSGRNYGFQSEIFYSVNDKRGLVFLTNSNHGSFLIKELNQLAANLDLSFLFQ